MTGKTAPKYHRTLSSDGSDLRATIAYAESEKEAVHTQKARLAVRASRGKDWDGVAANDNIAWPLATALIREGNTELLKAAMYYRKIHDTAKSEAKLGGSSVSLGDGVSVDQRQWLKPNGEIAYKGARKANTSAPEVTARRKSQTDGEAQLSSEKADSGYTNVPKIWKGDEPVNNMIDAQRSLSRLRAMLGILLEPFEMSVVDGSTYEDVGYTLGNSHKVPATAAGRSVIHMGLVAIRDAIGNVRRNDLAA